MDINNNIWTQKYKSNKVNITSLNKFIESKEIPNMLFYGTSGTGKTSTINYIKDQVYGTKQCEMVLEINGSENRGINIFKTTIKNFCNSNVFFKSTNKKLIIIDEADSLTKDAQILLQLYIKKYKKVIFCIICNYINNINPTVSSLCLKYFFKPLTLEKFRSVLKNISAKEGFSLTDNEYDVIYEISNKDMRKGINILQIIRNNECKDLYNFFNYPKNNILEEIYTTIISDMELMNIYTDVNKLIIDNNISFKILIPLFLRYIIKNGFFDINKLSIIIEKNAEIEYNISKDYTHMIQLLGFIISFK